MSERAVKLFFLQALVIVMFYLSCQGRRESGGDEGVGTGGESDPDKELTAIAAKPVSSGSAKVTDPYAVGLGIPFARTPLSRYVFPVVSGTFGSAWCTCRSIGTSPHVGQDIIDNGVGSQRSIAMSNGQVVGMTFDSACGWRVQFKDSMGAVWHYVHLNKPFVAESQIVPRGTVLGINGDYPTAGCGSGPHLHLERRSPGVFGSPEEFRTCQYGATTCYYNPRSPIEAAMVIRSESARSAVVAESPLDASATSTFSLDAGGQQTSFEARSLFDDINKCKLKLAGRGGDSSPSIVAGAMSRELEVADLKVQAADSGWSRLSFKIGLRSNEANRCDGEGNCIVSWTAYRMEKGRRAAILGGVGTSGQRISMEPEQGICVEQASAELPLQFLFEAETRSGKILSAMVWHK